MRGTAIFVPLLETPEQTRLGRFGWKNSIASLLSFSAGAYLAEMGITSPLLQSEQTSLGRNVMAFDLTPDPEDTGGQQGFGEDVEAFTRFMRSTNAPPRDRTLVPDDAADPGSALFDQISCSVCHVRSITTAPAGTVLNGGTFVVPTALGDKIIHPFSDQSWSQSGGSNVPSRLAGMQAGCGSTNSRYKSLPRRRLRSYRAVSNCDC